MSFSIRDQRFEKLRPQFRNGLVLSGLTTLCVVLALMAKFEDGDLAIRQGSTIRMVVALVGYISLPVFVMSGALLAGEWLLRKYSAAWRF